MINPSLDTAAGDGVLVPRKACSSTSYLPAEVILSKCKLVDTMLDLNFCGETTFPAVLKG